MRQWLAAADRAFFALALCLLALSLLPAPGLRVAGATSLLGLAESALPAWRIAFGPGIRLGALGSAYGLSALLRRSADLALSDLPLAAPGVDRRVVARMALAVIASPGLPQALSTAQLQAVLQGRIRNWAALGGPNLPLRLVLRTPGSGARALAAQFARGPLFAGSIQAPSSGQVAQLVQTVPGAIGVVERAYAPEGLVVRLDGLLPGAAGYPLNYPAYALFRRGDAKGALAADILADRAGGGR